ncbi:hypothetical protein D5018_02520 [Parashewanella curva]|uniref:Uncharacterized protein n=1 Tax=Parashewanella curva TaxID=2338552 RepID=A0A3L8Q2U3_9GAMM|nr:hypothetical protein [Parashewanella curva]RLV61369.1 hypothetical protein D5018_02520 [Parashewanella curva]
MQAPPYPYIETPSLLLPSDLDFSALPYYSQPLPQYFHVQQHHGGFCSSTQLYQYQVLPVYQDAFVLWHFTESAQAPIEREDEQEQPKIVTEHTPTKVKSFTEATNTSSTPPIHQGNVSSDSPPCPPIPSQIKESLPSAHSKFEITQIYTELISIDAAFRTSLNLKERIDEDRFKNKITELLQRTLIVSKKYCDFLHAHSEITQWLKSMPDGNFKTPSDLGLYSIHIRTCYALFNTQQSAIYDADMGAELSTCLSCFYCSHYFSAFSVETENEHTIYKGFRGFTPSSWLVFQFELMEIIQKSLTIEVIPNTDSSKKYEMGINRDMFYHSTYIFMTFQSQVLRTSHQLLSELQRTQKCQPIRRVHKELAPQIEPKLRPQYIERFMNDLARVKRSVVNNHSLSVLFISCQKFVLLNKVQQFKNRLSYIHETLVFLGFFSNAFQTAQVLCALCQLPISKAPQPQQRQLYQALAQHIDFLTKQPKWTGRHKTFALVIHHLMKTIAVVTSCDDADLKSLQLEFEKLSAAHPEFANEPSQPLPRISKRSPLKPSVKHSPKTEIPAPQMSKRLIFRSDIALQHLLKKTPIFKHKGKFSDYEIVRNLSSDVDVQVLKSKMPPVPEKQSTMAVDKALAQWYTQYLDDHPFDCFLLTEPHLKVPKKVQSALNFRMKWHDVMLRNRLQALLTEYVPLEKPTELSFLCETLRNNYFKTPNAKALTSQMQQLLSLLKLRNHQLSELIKIGLMIAHCNQFIKKPLGKNEDMFSENAQQAIAALQQRVNALQALDIGVKKINKKEYTDFVKTFSDLAIHGEHSQLNYMIFEVWPNSTQFKQAYHQQLLSLQILISPDNFLPHLQALDAIEYQQHSFSCITIRLCATLTSLYKSNTEALLKCATLGEFEKHQQRKKAIEHTIEKGWLHKHMFACCDAEDLSIETCQQLLQQIVSFPLYKALAHEAHLKIQVRKLQQQNQAFVASLPETTAKTQQIAKSTFVPPKQTSISSEQRVEEVPIPQSHFASDADKWLQPIEAMAPTEPLLAIEHYSSMIMMHSENLHLCFRARIGKAHAAMMLLSPRLNELLAFNSDTLKFNEGFRKAIEQHNKNPRARITHPDPSLFTRMRTDCIEVLPTIAKKVIPDIQQTQFHISDIDAIPDDLMDEPRTLAFCRDEIKETEQKILSALELLHQFEVFKVLKKEFNARLAVHRHENPSEHKVKTIEEIEQATQTYLKFSINVKSMRESFTELQQACKSMHSSLVEN